MLHLLTEEHRTKVAGEYKKRVTIIFLLGIFVIVLIVSAFLLPIYITSYGRYSEVLMQQDALNSQTTKADDSSSQSVKDMIGSLQALHIFDSQKSVSGIIEHVVNARPTGVQIKGMVFSPSSDSSVTVDIAGRASARNSLVSFNENLKQDQVFSQVQIPLSSFAKEKDIDFSVKLLISSTSTVAFDTGTSVDMASSTLSSAFSSSTPTNK